MPIRSILLSLSVLVLISVPTPAQPPGPARPAISFEPQTVVASGLTPRGRVVWFVVTIYWQNNNLVRVIRRQE